MQYIHVRSLEKYHPGYKDRALRWAKINFKMVQGDPDCELITNEIDWGRLIKFILLELQAQKPIPLDDTYLTKKGFDLKKRSISLTLQMLHNFLDTVEICNGTFKSVWLRVDKNRVDIDGVTESSVTAAPTPAVDKKQQHLTAVYLLPQEHAKLVARLGEEETAKYIFRVNNYICQHGKKYKSHYHTILAWWEKDQSKQ